jgi:hypothetical protein
MGLSDLLWLTKQPSEKLQIEWWIQQSFLLLIYSPDGLVEWRTRPPYDAVKMFATSWFS